MPARRVAEGVGDHQSAGARKWVEDVGAQAGRDCADVEVESDVRGSFARFGADVVGVEVHGDGGAASPS